MFLAVTASAVAAGISGRATVVNGDTTHVEGLSKNSRLFVVDAPESGQTSAEGAGQALSLRPARG